MSPRNLGWQDGWLVWRYRGRLACLSARRWATGRCGWPGGWWGVLRPSNDHLVAVHFADGVPLLARAEMSILGRPVGWLTHLAPAEALAQGTGAWEALIEHIAREAGRRGIRYLATEIPDQAEGLPTLQKAGLLPLLHLPLWRWEHTRPKRISTTPWHPLPSAWMGEAQNLWHERVPPAVRPVIPQPQAQTGWWGVRAGRALAGIAWVDSGPGGTWVQLFLRPAALPQGERLIAALVHQLQSRFASRPLRICTVAGDGLEDRALEALGARQEARWLLLARPVGLTVNATDPAHAALTQPLRPIAPPGWTKWTPRAPVSPRSSLCR